MTSFRLQQPLPGNFQLYHVTSGSLAVTAGHMMSFLFHVTPPPASYSLVGNQTHKRRNFLAYYRHFQVTSGQMT